MLSSAILSVHCIFIAVLCITNALPLSNVSIDHRAPKNILLPMANESAAALVNVTRSASTHDAKNITATNEQTHIQINNDTNKYMSDDIFDVGDIDYAYLPNEYISKYITQHNTEHKPQEKSPDQKSDNEMIKQEEAYWKNVYGKLLQKQVKTQQLANKVKLEIEKCNAQEDSKTDPKDIQLQQEEASLDIAQLKEWTQHLSDIIMDFGATHPELDQIHDIFRHAQEMMQPFDFQPFDEGARDVPMHHSLRRTMLQVVM